MRQKSPTGDSAYNPSPADFNNVGCAANIPDSASNPIFDSDSMTDAVCDDACGVSIYFAIQYGRDCYCFDDEPTINDDQGDCTYPNSGDGTQIGGSNNAYSVFTTAPATGPGTTDVPQFIGFFRPVTSPNANGQTPPLLGQDGVDPISGDDVTQNNCKASCSLNKYFGLTAGNTCICDNSYPFDNAVPITGAEINTLCGLRLIGNETQSGGGTDCIALFGNLDYQTLQQARAGSPGWTWAPRPRYHRHHQRSPYDLFLISKHQLDL
ncbi:hypothetical protein B5807_08603 [Epicoccum nigrum]|uniref:WSC domain-containing protein n=1 Tax=Epicoccum nigrum TaxID=105696 RepID=A0A1Y2LTE2_EPING|nr:hypothetical protein B5807_08603 [Epicoccum nigrum]